MIGKSATTAVCNGSVLVALVMGLASAVPATAQQPAPVGAMPAAPPGPAGQPQAVAPLDPARVAAARDLVAAMDARNQAQASIVQLKQALIMRIQASDPKRTVGFAAYAEREMDPNGPRVQALVAELENSAVSFYAHYFAPEEMAQIAAFQRSAAGRKFTQYMPELGAVIGQRMGQFQVEVMQAVEQGAAAGAQR